MIYNHLDEVKFMKIDNMVFAEKNITKLLLKFAIPSVISLLIQELYNMVDTVYVGRYVGVNAIAAMTIAFPIQKLITAIGLLIAVGASTYVARTLGEKNVSELKKIILNSLFLALLTLTFISILTFIFREPILHTLGASEIVYPLANQFVSIILIGGIFQSLAFIYCYIMVSFGNTKMTLYTSILGLVLNIIINYILVVTLKMGIQGSAIATVTSQIFSFIFAYFKFNCVKKVLNIKFSIHSINKTINKTNIAGIISTGFPTFVIEFSDALVALVLNKILYAEGGDAAIVMVGVITKVSMFMFITIIGISSSMQPIVSYNFGAKNYDFIKKAVTIGVKTVTIASFIFWAILMFFSNSIIGSFIMDETLLVNTVNAFRVCISLIPLIGIYYITIYYFQAIGEAKKSLLFSIYREIIVFIPLAILFVQFWGINGAWIAYPVTDAIVALTSAFSLKKTLGEDLSEVVTEFGK